MAKLYRLCDSLTYSHDMKREEDKNLSVALPSLSSLDISRSKEFQSLFC
jgi:hypothetical protein